MGLEKLDRKPSDIAIIICICDCVRKNQAFDHKLISVCRPAKSVQTTVVNLRFYLRGSYRHPRVQLATFELPGPHVLAATTLK